MEQAYLDTPVLLRLTYFLWIVFLSLYWYADLHDKYNSNIKDETIISKVNNIDWAFPIAGIIILLLNQSAIILKFDLNIYLLKIPIIKNFVPFITSIKESSFFTEVLSSLGIILMLFGLYIAAQARAALNGYWNTSIVEYKDEYKKLVQKGIYGSMRHPIYVAQFLLALGSALASGSFFVFLFPYIMYHANKKRAIKEDEALEKTFGEDFETYKGSVSACGLRFF